MTQEEIEKQAEIYAKEKHCMECSNLPMCWEDAIEDCCLTCKRTNEDFKAGAKWGMEHEWHDLRKDPNDLPEDCTKVMFITKNGRQTLTGTYKNGGGEGTPIFDTFGIAFYDIEEVIAWCELPKFKE